MARHLGRSLTSSEYVHHRNSKRSDNRLANLRLASPKSHSVAPADYIAKLTTEIEASARTLAGMQIDTTVYLKRFIKELEELIPDQLF